VRRRLSTGVVPSTGRRLPGIEGLRALAALSILVVHTWGEAGRAGPPTLGPAGRHFPDLSFGVTLFFALSGFLLYRPFAAALLSGDRRPSFATYLRNRALRILPAYWFILLFCSFVFRDLNVRDASGELHHHALSSPGLLLRTATLTQHYQPSTLLTGIGPAWSLAVEVVFYLALPLLVLLAWRLGASATTTRARAMAALAPAVLLFAVGMAGRSVAAFVLPAPVDHGWSTDWHSVVERSFLSQADLFTFGLALAVIHPLWHQGLLSAPKHWRLATSALCVGAYLFLARISWTEYQLSYSFYNVLAALVVGLLLALVILPVPSGRSLLVRVLETPVLVGAGVVSYSVFLWHEPVIIALRDRGWMFDGDVGFFANLALVVIVTGVLSVLSYRFIEAPALRLKGKLGRRQEAVPAAQVQAAP
jgi:peptidoglycan/LPS O-acetylase OafA/YrhL